MNDSEAKATLVDRTDFKLSVAKQFLEKIGDIPYSEGKKDFQLELCAEGFLLFSNGVIEILTDEINDKFQIFGKKNFQAQAISYEQNLTEDDAWTFSIMKKGLRREPTSSSFNIYNLRDKLDLNDSLQKLIFDLIKKYFEYPQPIIDGWNFSHSSLWKLRELRNHVAHNRALNRNYVTGTKYDVQYIFRFKPISWLQFHIVMVVKSPQNFFKEIFDDLIIFRNEVRSIIPYSRHSDQYKNQLDFGLQF